MKYLLGIDTATSQTVAALSGWSLSRPSDQRHSAVLFGLLHQLLGEPGTPSLSDMTAVVVGTGPGNFTGLRIGMATAKTTAYAMGIPIVGVPTPGALARAALDADPDALYDRVAAGTPIAVLQPAGPTDRYLSLVRVELEHGDAELIGPSRVLSQADSVEGAVEDALLVAVDVAADESLPAQAVRHGQAAIDGLGAALVAIGQHRLREGRIDDVAELVPAYVTLPRGVTDTAERMTWSPALR